MGLCDVVGGQVVDRKSWLVNQDMEIPEGASNIHGITTADIQARGIRPQTSATLALAAFPWEEVASRCRSALADKA